MRISVSSCVPVVIVLLAGSSAPCQLSDLLWVRKRERPRQRCLQVPPFTLEAKYGDHERLHGSSQDIRTVREVSTGTSFVRSEMRRHDTYCSNFSCTPATLAVGLRPGARRAMDLPSNRSRPATNSAVPSGRPLPSASRRFSKS
jgi:hypothetical protein